MPRRSLSLLITLIAAVGSILASCSDGETDADPTPAGIGDEDSDATVPRDDDGAVGEPDDEDSQTDAADGSDDVVPNDDSPSGTNGVAGSGDDVVPVSNRARVVGPFGERDLDLLLTEDARCAVEEAEGGGGETAAEVTGATSDGARFDLDWSVDAGRLDATLEMAGTTWTVDRDLDGADDRIIRLTRNGELLLDTTFRSDDGRSADAQLFVNCQPVEG